MIIEMLVCLLLYRMIANRGSDGIATGSVFTIRDWKVELSQQLPERNRVVVGQCAAVTTATNGRVVLKIRYDSVLILNHKVPDATNPSILD